jgi:glycosyltransferase involved in cell wall biosynthesis
MAGAPSRHLGGHEMRKLVRILGIRGIPAAHGGFETFAEKLALFLIAQGWRVVVYCQEDGSGPVVEDCWQGVERVRIPTAVPGPRGTIVFDWKATLHAARHDDLCLTLGYNTAVFCALLRLRGIPNLINMDGIEWSRAKWGPLAKAWFWLNERAGCWLGNHLVADHPEIEAHLRTRVRGSKITTIPYGAEAIGDASPGPLAALGLEPGTYLTTIARPEPENSLLEIVEGFTRKPRGCRLVVLGQYDAGVAYHRAVTAAAGAEVLFIGATYDKALVQALRRHSVAYVHGHQVGGTNPSLVEALGAGNAVIAHDNRFNRWVVGDGAVYFDDAESFSARLDELLSPRGLAQLQDLRRRAQHRFDDLFTWPAILQQYETLLEHWLPAPRRAASPAGSSRSPSPGTRGQDPGHAQLHRPQPVRADPREAAPAGGLGASVPRAADAASATHPSDAPSVRSSQGSP